MRTITKKDLVIPKHNSDSHKGQNGEVLIIGGSEDYIGCLALAGLAALRTGIDWITIAAPEKVAWAVSGLSYDLITKKFRGKYFTSKHYKQMMELVEKHDAILIGNGIGIKKETRLFIKKLIKNIRKPLVIDADGIKLISLNDVDSAILTPHKKEFEILLKNTRISENKIKQNIKNNIIIKKGKIDLVITKNHFLQNKTGNEAMSKAGTGDVLAGFTVGFLAQGLSLEQSAINAIYINGKIGDYLKDKKGYSFIASDLINDYDKICSIKKRSKWKYSLK
jgi:ADP-dependent NAD(P)H-hydrate dehydratase / NAD(P)H-hydrate epimerase